KRTPIALGRETGTNGGLRRPEHALPRREGAAPHGQVRPGAATYYVNKALIFVLRVVIQVAKSPASVAEPATTPVATATRTRAYSTKSWPDSSRWNLLMNCRNVMHPPF